jgi:hypothetical protein
MEFTLCNMTFFLAWINTEQTVALNKTFMFKITKISNNWPRIQIAACKFFYLATVFLLNCLALLFNLNLKIHPITVFILKIFISIHLFIFSIFLFFLIVNKFLIYILSLKLWCLLLCLPIDLIVGNIVITNIGQNIWRLVETHCLLKILLI